MNVNSSFSVSVCVLAGSLKYKQIHVNISDTEPQELATVEQTETVQFIPSAVSMDISSITWTATCRKWSSKRHYKLVGSDFLPQNTFTLYYQLVMHENNYELIIMII